MGIELATLGPALLAGGSVSALARAPDPNNRRGDPYAVLSRRTPNRFARKRGVYNAISQILALGPRHGASPSQSHGKTRMSPTRGESPIESNESERAPASEGALSRSWRTTNRVATMAQLAASIEHGVNQPIAALLTNA